MDDTTVSTVYETDGSVIMKGCAKWTPDEKNSSGIRTWTGSLAGQCLAYWGSANQKKKKKKKKKREERHWRATSKWHRSIVFPHVPGRDIIEINNNRNSAVNLIIVCCKKQRHLSVYITLWYFLVVSTSNVQTQPWPDKSDLEHEIA